eukprot:4967641-Prorocentrum_lima.AAC.1
MISSSSPTSSGVQVPGADGLRSADNSYEYCEKCDNDEEGSTTEALESGMTSSIVVGELSHRRHRCLNLIRQRLGKPGPMGPALAACRLLVLVWANQSHAAQHSTFLFSWRALARNCWGWHPSLLQVLYTH